MLLAGLFAGAASAQTARPVQPSAAATGTQSGAAPTRANGVPPTAPGLNGINSAQQAQPGTNSSGPGATSGNAGAGANNGNGAGRSSGGRVRNRNRTSQSPVPAANGNIHVTGFPSQNRPGSVDHPLLPIVSPGNGLGIRSGTAIEITLRAPIDSGHARNGDMIEATLAAPLAGLPAGTPVRLTVVQAARAGSLSSFGELSIQVVSIADRRVLSDTITAQGKEGPKELPDAAPARGTEAIFTPDQPISLPAS